MFPMYCTHFSPYINVFCVLYAFFTIHQCFLWFVRRIWVMNEWHYNLLYIKKWIWLFSCRVSSMLWRRHLMKSLFIEFLQHQQPISSSLNSNIIVESLLSFNMYIFIRIHVSEYICRCISMWAYVCRYDIEISIW